MRPIRIPGEETRDSMRLVTKAAEVLNQRYDGYPVTMMFIDGTGIGGPIVDRLKQLGHANVMEVQFGGRAPDLKYANMRSYMWGQMRDWLGHGSIDDDARLEQDVIGPDYHHDTHDRLVLKAKERMKKPPCSRRRSGRSAGVGGGTCFRTLAQPRGPAARWIGCDDAETSGLCRRTGRTDPVVDTTQTSDRGVDCVRTQARGILCRVCGAAMRRLRADHEYCSARCRRRGHRQSEATRRQAFLDRVLPDDPGRPE